MQQCAQIWRNFVTWQNLENFRVYLVGIWQIIEPNTINVLQSSKLSCCKWPNNIGNWSHCFRVIKNEFFQNKIRTVSCGFNLGNIFSIFVDHEFRQIAYLPTSRVTRWSCKIYWYQKYLQGQTTFCFISYFGH